MAFDPIATAGYREEFLEIEDYISNVLLNPIAARNLAVKVDRVVSVIADNPFIFPLYHDERIAKLGYRFAAVENYLLFYTVDEDWRKIYLSHLLNGRQNVQMHIK